MRHHPTLPQRLEIRPRQTLSQYLGAGTLIHVIGGRVHLTEPPQWLGDRVRLPKRQLLAGQTHVIADGGWLSFQAGEQPALLLCHAPVAEHRPGRGALPLLRQQPSTAP